MESTIVKNLSEIIKEKGYKKGYIASRAGLTPNMLSDMLNGRKTIKDTHVAALAIALEVTPNDLFGVKSKIS